MGKTWPYTSLWGKKFPVISILGGLLCGVGVWLAMAGAAHGPALQHAADPEPPPVDRARPEQTEYALFALG
jgi:hypothetical protein